MQSKIKYGVFYDYFPPYAADSLDFLLKSKNMEAYYAIDEAWKNVFSARDEWQDKDKQDISESDVKRWKEAYDTYRKIVLEGLRDEYKQEFIDGKLI